MAIIKHHPLIETILESWRSDIGEVYDGYRGHVYRMFNCCLHLSSCDKEGIDRFAIAAAFHDLGIWSDHTVDYLPPSIRLAQEWLVEHDLSHWSEEITLMIDMHHKVRPYKDTRYPMVEVFRKADLVDFSLGAFRAGIPSKLMTKLKQEFPNAGFHKFLIGSAKSWFIANPLSPPPFMKW